VTVYLMNDSERREWEKTVAEKARKENRLIAIFALTGFVIFLIPLAILIFLTLSGHHK